MNKFHFTCTCIYHTPVQVSCCIYSKSWENCLKDKQWSMDLQKNGLFLIQKTWQLHSSSQQCSHRIYEWFSGSGRRIWRTCSPRKAPFQQRKTGRSWYQIRMEKKQGEGLQSSIENRIQLYGIRTWECFWGPQLGPDWARFLDWECFSEVWNQELKLGSSWIQCRSNSLGWNWEMMNWAFCNYCWEIRNPPLELVEALFVMYLCTRNQFLQHKKWGQNYTTLYIKSAIIIEFSNI